MSSSGSSTVPAGQAALSSTDRDTPKGVGANSPMTMQGGTVSKVDYGESPHPCVSCDRPTDFGSGLFVNRILASHGVSLPDGTYEERDGYMCVECSEEIGYETSEGDVCRECGDVEGHELGPDCVPFWLDEAREEGRKRECMQCNNVIYDPSWPDETP